MLGQRTVSEKWDLGDISPELTDALAEDIGFPADVAVDYRRIAASYLMDNFPVPSLRFDTIGVVVDGDDQVGIVQACGAFDWECEM